MDFSFRQFIFAAVAIFTIAAPAVANDMTDEAIAERIKPVGSLYLEGEAPAVEVDRRLVRCDTAYCFNFEGVKNRSRRLGLQ